MSIGQFIVGRGGGKTSNNRAKTKAMVPTETAKSGPMGTLAHPMDSPRLEGGGGGGGGN